MKPAFRRFDSIRETREYVFDYDDTETVTLRVMESSHNGLFIVYLMDDGNPDKWTRLHGYEKRPTLIKLAKVAKEQIAYRICLASASIP
jgi:hypothetical protein